MYHLLKVSMLTNWIGV